MIFGKRTVILMDLNLGTLNS